MAWARVDLTRGCFEPPQLALDGRQPQVLSAVDDQLAADRSPAPGEVRDPESERDLCGDADERQGERQGGRCVLQQHDEGGGLDPGDG